MFIKVHTEFLENIEGPLFGNQSEVHFSASNRRQDRLQTSVLVARIQSSYVRCRLKRELFSEVLPIKALHESTNSKSFEPFWSVVRQCFYCSDSFRGWFPYRIIETIYLYLLILVLDSLQRLQQPPRSRWENRCVG